jgi:hypothetical protein
MNYSSLVNKMAANTVGITGPGALSSNYNNYSVAGRRTSRSVSHPRHRVIRQSLSSGRQQLSVSDSKTVAAGPGPGVPGATLRAAAHSGDTVSVTETMRSSSSNSKYVVNHSGKRLNETHGAAKLTVSPSPGRHRLDEVQVHNHRVSAAATAASTLTATLARHASGPKHTRAGPGRHGGAKATYMMSTSESDSKTTAPGPGPGPSIGKPSSTVTAKQTVILAKQYVKLAPALQAASFKVRIVPMLKHADCILASASSVAFSFVAETDILLHYKRETTLKR